MVGQHPESQLYGIKKQLHNLLKHRVRDFVDRKMIRVGCLTWNCAGNALPHDMDITDIVLP